MKAMVIKNVSGTTKLMKTIDVKGLVGDFTINNNNDYPISIHRVIIVSVTSDDNVYYRVKDYYPGNQDEDEWSDFVPVYETLDAAVEKFKELLNKIKL